MAIPLEAYYTPFGLTKALINKVIISGEILECCCRLNYSIVNVLDEELSDKNLWFTDIALNPFHDATSEEYWLDMTQNCTNIFDWVITNPPFSVSTKILEHASNPQ